MLRALALIAVREEQDHAAHALPLRFGADNKLVDNGLRTVGKITELRLPQAEHLRIIEAVTVIETQHARLG